MSEILELTERIRLALRVGESLYREFKSAKQGPPGAKVNREFKEIARDIAQTPWLIQESLQGELG